MAGATKYNPGSDFSGDENNGVSGRSNVRTASLDSELTNISNSISQIVDNQNTLQRDDGLLGNKTVHIDAMTDEVFSQLRPGWNPRGDWATATVYSLLDVVAESENGYIAVKPHTAGVFATDLTNGNWVPVAYEKSKVIASIAGLKALPVPANNTKAFVLGYYNEGDGGGGAYYYDTASTDADNGGTIIQSDTLPASGRWVFQGKTLVTVQTFGAKIDGVTDDYAPVMANINALTTGDVLTIPTGTCVIGTKITAILPRSVTINCQATLQFSGLSECMELTALGADVNIKRIDCLASCGIAVIIKSCMRSKFDFREITGGSNITTAGIKVVGRYATLDGDGNSLNGVIYNEIKTGVVQVHATTGVNILATTEFNGSPGYVNENDFYAKWLDGYDGIKFVKGIGQTDRFNNNRLLWCGFENITNSAITWEYSIRNVIHSPRFESIGVTEVYEDADSYQNTYFITYSSNHTKWSLNGYSARIIGNGRDNTGGMIFRDAMQDATGDWVYIADNYHANMNNNTLFFKRSNKSKGIFDGYAFGIKDSAGVLHDVAAISPDGFQQINGVSGTVVIQDNISSIRAANDGGNIALKMPAIKEEDGVFIKLNVYFYNSSNTIEILKSTGASHIAAGQITKGIWLLTYQSGSWFAAKISAQQFTSAPLGYKGSITWNPGTLVDGAGITSAAIPITNAAPGDEFIVYPPVTTSGVKYWGFYDSVGNAKIRLENNTGGSVVFTNLTWEIEVRPK